MTGGGFRLTVAYREGDVSEVGTFDDLAEADKRFEAAVAGLRSIRWDGTKVSIVDSAGDLVRSETLTFPPIDPYGH